MLYECAYCGSLADGEHTVEVSIEPGDTEGFHDGKAVLCSNCNQKRGDSIEEGEIKEAARNALTEQALEDEEAQRRR